MECLDRSPLESVYQAIFEDAPVAIWDEDFSAVKRFIDDLRATGVQDIREYLHSHPDAVEECVRRVRVRHVNRVAREFYGARTEEDLIASLPRLFDAVSLNNFRDEVIALAEGSRSFGSELFATTLSGERRLVQMNVSIVGPEPSDWSRVVVAFTDVSERRRLEQSLERANESLRRLNRDLEQFAWAAAHDMREPLRTIALYAQVLQRVQPAPLPGSSGEKALNFILSNARRMETLIEDLLRFARAVEPRSWEASVVADSHVVVEDVLMNLSATIADANAQLNIPDRLPAVRIEPSHLTQVFQNLITNAIKYREPDRQAHIRITASTEDHRVEFCVADNGIGINPEYHDRIFHVFKRLHGIDVEGNGIGLALCKKIVEEYGGRSASSPSLAVAQPSISPSIARRNGYISPSVRQLV
jgi:signal transduction histidine kinase